MDERDQLLLEGFNLGLSAGQAGGNHLQVLREVVEGTRTVVHGVADLRVTYGDAIPPEVYRQLEEKHRKLVETSQHHANRINALRELGKV